jgi:hypothetical protein
MLGRVFIVMFGRLFNSRLKAAENALQEGRLDEAYRLAIQPDLREHRRGAAVLATLTEKFIERARGFYREDRFRDAMLDLDRAEAGGGMKNEIAELRGYVQTVAAEHERHEDSRRQRLDAAVKRIEGGSLAAGRDMLERVATEDRAAHEVRRKADERAADAKRMVEHAERLLAAGQIPAAAERVRKAKAVDAHNEHVARLELQLCQKVMENARAAIVEGKLGRAADELACVGDLGRTLPSRRELADLLTVAQEAAAFVSGFRYAEARRQVMSLARQLPDAGWLKMASEQLRQLDEFQTALLAGPLGDRVVLSPSPKEAGHDGQSPPYKVPSLDDTVALPGRIDIASGVPERLLLLVDGGGSYLILRGGQASVGRAASEHPADVPIFSDVAERHANVARVDDDYFLFGVKEVEVGGNKTQHQLLRDGDRIVLGKKAKFTFRLPSRKSPSAVLELSDTTKMPNDVRRVVLFNQHATVGNGPTAHILCRHAGAPLVVFERAGQLWIRRQSDGHVDTEAKPLRLSEPVEIGGVSLVLEPWKTSAPGTKMT